MLVRDIVREALERLAIPASNEAINASDMSTCVTSFKMMVEAMPGFSIGAGLVPVSVTASPHLATPDTMVVWGGVGELTLNLPALVDGLPPANGARVGVTSGGNASVHVYIASSASWLHVQGITELSVDPLGADCNHALADLLAGEIASKFSVDLTEQLARRISGGKAHIEAKFRGSRPKAYQRFPVTLSGQGNELFALS